MKKSLTVTFAFWCCFYKLIETSAEEEKIHGGHPINITDAPYMVHISYVSRKYQNGSMLTHECGGTILRKNLILTAGHCKKVLITFQNLLLI